MAVEWLTAFFGSACILKIQISSQVPVPRSAEEALEEDCAFL